ncbi:MAG: cache domain-containing protein [Desulforegulaceae bacterium]|nr:cache domain-containing protein [Desulforegulaceae bacterium]
MNKIITKILISIMLCSIIVAVSIGSLSVLQTSKIIYQETSDKFHYISANYANEFSAKLKKTEGYVDVLESDVGSSFDPSQFVSNQNYQNEYMKRMNDLLKRIGDQNIGIQGIYVIINPELTGQVFESWYINDGKGHFIYQESEDISAFFPANEDMRWYYDAINNTEGVWIPPYIDATINLKMISYTKAIYKNGLLVGVVGIDLSFEDIEKTISNMKLYDSGYAFLINKDLTILVHPFLQIDRSILNLKDKDLNSIVESMEKNKSDVIEYVYMGKKKIMGFSKLSNGWILGVSTVISDIIKPINHLEKSIAVSIIILLIITGIIGLFISKSITKPISRLRDLAVLISQGQHEIKLDLNSNNEIGDLSKSISIMTKKLVISHEELKKSEELFKLIIGHTSALVSIHDSNAYYIFASPSFEKLGYKPEELIGQSGFKMMIKEDAELLLKSLDKAKQGKISNALLNYRIKDKKGQTHYFRGSFDAVFKADGSMEKIVSVGEDITELKKAQSEKETAFSLAAEREKLALVGQVAGKMAHDFNNILGIIMGNAELSLINCKDAKIKKKLELIFEQTLRGKNLTRNLVAFAKDQEPKQEFFSINEKIELVITLMKKDLEGIKVEREYRHDLPEVLADPGMIEHAIVNLVQNSIHAISLVKYPKIIFRTYQQNEQIFIEIEDNGCGIPQKFLGEIFEPSFTLKGSKDLYSMYKQDIRGTGYGMSNVKKYIEQHKGDISFFSELQKGSKVIISLPVIKKELTTREIEKVKKEKTFSGKYILLVEDELSISDIYSRILTDEPWNHKVDIARNGQAAMDLLNGNQYDLISLDYFIPGKFNGMDVYHHIRKTNKTIPILFVSGNIEFIESIKELKQNDANICHLSKPCMNIDYVNAVNKLFANLVG